ncbi:MAG: hypothetical protein HY675_04675 [Chloroflexi bacterium]|nr:hypothetical protein [Chloroflexota bacterium]
MPNDRARRCRYCGGTLWQDGDVVKCFMCSRPAEGGSGRDRLPSSLSHPKLPGTPGKSAYRREK